eukprot:scaffold3910_cov537-Prasinococcus_capsulatus_cf.AAC.5
MCRDERARGPSERGPGLAGPCLPGERVESGAGACSSGAFAAHDPCPCRTLANGFAFTIV